jgi:hypothetical protein
MWVTIREAYWFNLLQHSKPDHLNTKGHKSACTNNRKKVRAIYQIYQPMF